MGIADIIGPSSTGYTRTRQSIPVASREVPSLSGALRSSRPRRPRVAASDVFGKPSGGGGGRSLFGQVTDIFKAMPAGVAALTRAAVDTVDAPARFVIDAARGKVRGTESLYDFYREYAPLTQMVTDSLENTVSRLSPIVTNPNPITGVRELYRNYQDESGNSNIVNAILEDIGNIALVGGPAAKALGSASLTVNVPSTAVKAALEGGEVGVRGLSAGAVAGETAARVIPRRLPVLPGEVAPMTVEATLPGTGLAGALERAGHTTAAARVARVGSGVRTVARLGEAVDNAQLAWPAKAVTKPLGYAARKAAPSVIRGLERASEGSGVLSGVAAQLTPDSFARRAETTLARETVDRTNTAMIRAAAQAKKVGDELGLSPVETRAAQYAVDQRFAGLADAVRSGVDDTVIQSLLDKAYDGLDDVMRPGIDDLRLYVGYVDGTLDPDLAARMAEVEQATRATASLDTDVKTKSGILNPEQLGDQFVGAHVDQIRYRLERRRDAALRQLDTATERAARLTRIDDATYIANRQLPGPPDPRLAEATGRAAGEASGRSTVLRREYEVRRRALDAEIKQYEKAERGTPQTRQLERRLDTLVDQMLDLETEINRIERRAQAAEPLTRATGRIEATNAQGVLPLDETPPTPPTPDVRQMGTVGAVRTVARQAADQERDVYHAALMNATDENVLRRPAPGEQWYAEYRQMFSEAKRKQYAAEGYAVSGDAPQVNNRRGKKIRDAAARGESVDLSAPRPKSKARAAGGSGGMLPDELAQVMSARLGRELTVPQAMQIYFDYVDNILDVSATGRRGASAGVVESVARQMGFSDDIVRAALDGSATDFRQAILDDVTMHLDDLHDAWQAVPDEYRADIIQMLRDSPETFVTDLNDIFADLGTPLYLEQVFETVPFDQLIDWLNETSPKAPPDIMYKAVVEPRGPVQQAFRQELQTALEKNSAKLAKNLAEQEAKRGQLTLAQAEAKGRLDVAARNVDQAGAAADTARGLADAAEARPSLAEVTDLQDPTGEWRSGFRYEKGPDGKRVRTNLDENGNRILSRGERRLVQEGAARNRAAVATARMKRLTRVAQRYTDKIADLPNELRRGFVERLRNDINQPAVNGLVNSVRSHSPRLGTVVTGPNMPPYLSGVVGDVARAYGISDDVIYRMIDARDAGQLNPTSAGAIMYDVADEYGVSFSDLDRNRLQDAVNAEQLVADISDTLDLAAAQGQLANAPFRVKDVIDSAQWIPDDLRSAMNSKWENYLKRRNTFLARSMDDYAAAMPARWRDVGANSRRAVRAQLELAEEYFQKGDTLTSEALVRMAEEVPTTLQQMIDSGIDPVKMVGGKEVAGGAGSTGASRLGFSPRSVRAEKTARTGLRVLDTRAYGQVQAQELSAIVMNNALDVLKDNPLIARPLQDVLGDQMPSASQGQAAWRAALSDAGYEVLPGEGGTLTPNTRVALKSVVKELQGLNMQHRTLLMRALVKGNRGFKTMVLPFSTKWLTGNIVGNAFMAMFGGETGGFGYMKRLKQIKSQMGSLADIWDQEGMPAWAPDELASHGLTYGEHVAMYGASGPDNPNMIQRFIQRSYNLNEMVDNMNRSAVYLDNLEKQLRAGKPFQAASEAAVQHALKAMGDFTRMTGFERRIVKEIIPFYPWLRHQTQAALRLPLTSPTRAAYLYALTNLAADDEFSADVLAFLGNRIPIAGGYLNIGGLSPFGNPMGLPLDPTTPEIMSSVTPVIKTPVQLLTGVEMGGGSEYFRDTTRPSEQTGTDEFGRPKSGGSVLRRALRGDPLGALRETAHITTGVLPQTKALRDIVYDVAGGELGDARYGSGDPMRTEKYDKPVSIRDVLLGGLSLPKPEYNLDEMIQTIERNARRGR